MALATSRWRRRRGTPRPEDALLEESEAFLAGELVDLLVRRGQPVPTWAWCNVLAHGTEAAVRSWTWTRSRTLHTQDRAWRDAVAFLALLLGAVTADGHRTLLELQRRLLVPLELDLLRRPCATPDELVDRAQRSLRLLV